MKKLQCLVILLVVALGAVASAACSTVPLQDARRFVQGEYPEYKILQEPTHSGNKPTAWHDDKFILCSPASHLAIAQIAISNGSVINVRKTDLDDLPIICGDMAKDPQQTANRLVRIKDIVDDRNDALGDAQRLRQIAEVIYKK